MPGLEAFGAGLCQVNSWTAEGKAKKIFLLFSDLCNNSPNEIPSVPPSPLAKISLILHMEAETVILLKSSHFPWVQLQLYQIL